MGKNHLRENLKELNSDNNNRDLNNLQMLTFLNGMIAVCETSKYFIKINLFILPKIVKESIPANFLEN